MQISSGDVQRRYREAFDYLAGSPDREVSVVRNSREVSVWMSPERAAEARRAIKLVRGLASLADADDADLHEFLRLLAPGARDLEATAPRPSAA